MAQRLEIFAKGNADVRDPVFGVRFADGAQWGGLNEAFRSLGWPVTARVRHETAVGFFALTGTPAEIPEDVAARAPAFGALPPAGQHSQALFDERADAAVLSLQPDVFAPVARHRASGLAFALHNARAWSEEDSRWREAAFERLPPAEPGDAMAALLAAVARFQAARDRPALVANLSAAVPGERLHAHLGVPDALSTRIRRFNLALLDAAAEADFSVLDVDRIVAEGGAERLLLGPFHYSLEACRRIALEVARILEERGVVTPC